MNAERDLWCAVLEAAISDAVNGASRMIFHDKATVDLETERARNFILRPNRDFNLICYLA
ncbi:MAG: hypothetical protein HZT43_11885 [Exiguobacterium profundum]|nr:MAG: hypothetical protein HZT43_11885 [Exiguobacterium profundum]